MLELVDLPSLSCSKLPCIPLRHMLDLLFPYLCFSFPNPLRTLSHSMSSPCRAERMMGSCFR